MPPPLTLPSNGGSSRVSAVVPASGPIVPTVSHSSGVSTLSSVSRGVDPPRSSTTTSTTHDSIVPEFNSTPVPQRDQQVSTREYHHHRHQPESSHHHHGHHHRDQFTPLPSSQQQHNRHHHHRGHQRDNHHHHGHHGGGGDHVHSINNSSNHNETLAVSQSSNNLHRANSPDFFGREHPSHSYQSQRDQQRQERLHHAGYTTSSSSAAVVTQQQLQQQRASIHTRVASPRYQPTPPPPPPAQAPPPATRSPQPQRQLQPQQQANQPSARTLEQVFHQHHHHQQHHQNVPNYNQLQNHEQQVIFPIRNTIQPYTRGVLLGAAFYFFVVIVYAPTRLFAFMVAYGFVFKPDHSYHHMLMSVSLCRIKLTLSLTLDSTRIWGSRSRQVKSITATRQWMTALGVTTTKQLSNNNNRSTGATTRQQQRREQVSSHE